MTAPMFPGRQLEQIARDLCQEVAREVAQGLSRESAEKILYGVCLTVSRLEQPGTAGTMGPAGRHVFACMSKLDRQGRWEAARAARAAMAQGVAA